MKENFYEIEMTDLLVAQRKLDDHILDNKNILFYPKTELTLACIVEIGELANEVRCFKFWSNKAPSHDKIILEEFSDVLHFTLSLTNDWMDKHTLNNKRAILRFHHETMCNSKEEISEKFNTLSRLILNGDPSSALKVLFRIGFDLGFTTEDIISEYWRKNKINYDRQANDY